MTEAAWLQRIIFLETVAAVPGAWASPHAGHTASDSSARAGMVAGAVRHLHSLRLMKGDGGWIHTLLEEAENEARTSYRLNFCKPRVLTPIRRSIRL